MKTLEEVASSVEAMCNQHGWDQLPMIFHIKRGDDSYEIVAMDVIEGSLYDSLDNTVADQNADCVALMTEGWTYSQDVADEIKKAADFMVENLGTNPEDTITDVSQMYYQFFPPSQDKNRVEVRTITAISLDEKPAVVMRRRDEDPETADAMDGRILDALTAFILRKRS